MSTSPKDLRGFDAEEVPSGEKKLMNNVIDKELRGIAELFHEQIIVESDSINSSGESEVEDCEMAVKGKLKGEIKALIADTTEELDFDVEEESERSEVEKTADNLKKQRLELMGKVG